jgi:hypothetical protein
MPALLTEDDVSRLIANFASHTPAVAQQSFEHEFLARIRWPVDQTPLQSQIADAWVAVLYYGIDRYYQTTLTTYAEFVDHFALPLPNRFKQSAAEKFTSLWFIRGCRGWSSSFYADLEARYIRLLPKPSNDFLGKLTVIADAFSLAEFATELTGFLPVHLNSVKNSAEQLRRLQAGERYITTADLRAFDNWATTQGPRATTPRKEFAALALPIPVKPKLKTTSNVRTEPLSGRDSRGRFHNATAVHRRTASLSFLSSPPSIEQARRQSTPLSGQDSHRIPSNIFGESSVLGNSPTTPCRTTEREEVLQPDEPDEDTSFAPFTEPDRPTTPQVVSSSALVMSPAGRTTSRGGSHFANNEEPVPKRARKMQTHMTQAVGDINTTQAVMHRNTPPPATQARKVQAGAPGLYRDWKDEAEKIIRAAQSAYDAADRDHKTTIRALNEHRLYITSTNSGLEATAEALSGAMDTIETDVPIVENRLEIGEAYLLALVPFKGDNSANSSDNVLSAVQGQVQKDKELLEADKQRKASLKEALEKLKNREEQSARASEICDGKRQARDQAITDLKGLKSELDRLIEVSERIAGGEAPMD